MTSSTIQVKSQGLLTISPLTPERFIESGENYWLRPPNQFEIQNAISDGLECYKHGMFQSAIDKFIKILENSHSPYTQYICYRYLSECYFAMNNLKDAVFFISMAFVFAGPDASEAILRRYSEIDSKYAESPFYEKSAEECLEIAFTFRDLSAPEHFIVLSLYNGLQRCSDFDSKISLQLYYNIVMFLCKMNKVNLASKYLQNSQLDIILQLEDKNNLFEKLATHLFDHYPQFIRGIFTDEIVQYAFEQFLNKQYLEALEVFKLAVTDKEIVLKDATRIYKCMSECAHELNNIESEIEFVFKAFLTTQDLVDELYFLTKLQNLYKTSTSRIAQISGGVACCCAVVMKSTVLSPPEQIVLLIRAVEDKSMEPSYLQFAKELLTVKLQRIRKQSLAIYYNAL